MQSPSHSRPPHPNPNTLPVAGLTSDMQNPLPKSRESAKIPFQEEGSSKGTDDEEASDYTIDHDEAPSDGTENDDASNCRSDNDADSGDGTDYDMASNDSIGNDRHRLAPSPDVAFGVGRSIIIVA